MKSMENKNKKQVKLNLGCGHDYREGFVNIDFNKKIKADIYCDLNKKLPFKDNSIDYVYSAHTFEHIIHYFDFIDELRRICKKGAIIEVYVPHFTSIFATKYPSHYRTFGIGSFVCFTDYSSDKQEYSRAKFEIITEKLIFAMRGHPFLYRWLNFTNFFWNINGSKRWQQICERFQIFGFDEIYFKLRVIK